MASEAYLSMKHDKYMLDNDDFWLEQSHDEMNNQQQVVFIREPFMSSAASAAAKPTKTRRRRWTQKDMTNAFNAVKCTGMSLRGAASHYNVPESTLRDRVHGRVSLDCSRPGPPTFFTFEEEKKMVDHILFMSKIGYPYTRNQVVELAGDMTKAVDRIAPFKFLNPSQAWFYAFLNRWPDLKNYLYGPRSNRKSKGVSAESIQSYYDNLEKVLCKYEIHNKPEHIWMTDEISIACDNSNVPKILPITIQRPQSNTYWNPTAAVLGAGNAAGDKVPAFLMFKASEVTNEMMEGAVKGSKFATSSTGWINADAFIQWYERHFRPLVKQRPVILLYDGHLQFVTVRVLERAKEDNVLLFPLPPHPPYNHCVESSCFSAYPKYFNRKIQKFHDDFKRNVNKSNVSKIICQAYESALTPINLISMFFKLGICPYNNLSSTIAPYMSEMYDYANDENQENHESDYSHGGKMYRGSDVPSDFETSADSPIDRSNYTPVNCVDEPCYMPAATSIATYQSQKYTAAPIITPTSMTSQFLNVISTSSKTITTNSNTNVMSSPIKFGTQQQVSHNSNNNSASNNASSLNSTPVKVVLDNMASKAMNQIHAHRTSVDPTTGKLVTKIIPLNSTGNNNNEQYPTPNFIPIKNFASNRGQIILCNKNNKTLSANTVKPNTIKLISSDLLNTISNQKSGSSTASVAVSSSSTTVQANPIKMIKTSTTNTITSGNVIIKTTSGKGDTGSRNLLRLHSFSTDCQPPNKKPTFYAKADGFIKCSTSDFTKLKPLKLAENAKVIMLPSSKGSSITTNANTINAAPEVTHSAGPATSVKTTYSPLERAAELMEYRSDVVNNDEEEEVSQTCHVCGCVEPPGLAQMPVESDELVVDWARCDFCLKWVHLQPCCDRRCVQLDNRFKCVVCIDNNEETDDDIDDKMHNDAEASSVIAAPPLLHQTQNQPHKQQTSAAASTNLPDQ